MILQQARCCELWYTEALCDFTTIQEIGEIYERANKIWNAALS